MALSLDALVTRFDELKALNSFIDNRRPLPFAQALPGAPSFTLQLPPIAYRIGFFALQSAMIGAGLLLALSIGVLLVQWSRGRQPSQMVIVSALCGVMVHGGFLLSALGSLGIPRYAIGLWVPLVLGSCLSMLWVFKSVHNVLFPNQGRT